MTVQTSPVIDLDAERSAAASAERQRSAAIVALGRAHGVDVQAHIDSGATVDAARAAVLDALAARSKSTQVDGSHRGGSAYAYGTDNQERKTEALVTALAVRGGWRGDVVDGQRVAPQVEREFGGVSLMRLAEDCLRARGLEPRDHTERGVAELAMSGGPRGPLATRSLSSALSTGDFPLLLANVANKFLRGAFGAEPMTHEPMVYDRAVRDTRQVAILSMGSVDALPTVVAGTEYTYATIGEAREVYNLAKFGKVLPLTIETLMSDDLGAFGRLGAELGRAAARTEKGLIYGSTGVLGSNSGAGQTMAAHGAIAAASLIHSTHGNAGTTGALSSTTLAELRKLMLAQTDDDGNIIGGLMPQYLYVPAALLDAAEILQQQRYVATAASGAAAQWIAGLKVVAEPRLDAYNSASRYWLFSGRPFIERARLQGEPAPTITTIEQPENDSIGYKVRYWCATKAADWRDIASNSAS